MKTNHLKVLLSATALSLVVVSSGRAQNQNSLAENPVPIIPGLPADQQPTIIPPGQTAPSGARTYLGPNGVRYYFNNANARNQGNVASVGHNGAAANNTVNGNVNNNNSAGVYGTVSPGANTTTAGGTVLPNGTTVSPNGVVSGNNSPNFNTSAALPGTTPNGSYNYGTTANNANQVKGARVLNNGVVVQPGGGTLPNGNAVAPVGGTMLPNGATELPNGTVINPNGTITQRALTTANGQAVRSGAPTTANSTATTGTKTYNGTVTARVAVKK